MNFCYLCGASGATKSLSLKDSFTAHSRAKVPESKLWCDRCAWVIPMRVKYYNPNTKKEGLLFSRTFSWLLSNQQSYPIFEGDRVHTLPNRALIRQWLINPPEPPFTIAIAESGQKHILFLAQEAQEKDRFPVLFELDLLEIDRAKFTEDLEQFELLMSLELTKTEILSGNYKSQNLLKLHSNPEFWKAEQALAPIRGTRIFELISHVACNKSVETD
jgi:hypothetical protein